MWARCQPVGGLPLAGRVVFTGVDSGMQIHMDGRGREPDQVLVGRLWRTVTHEEGYVKASHLVRSGSYSPHLARVDYKGGAKHAMRPLPGLGARAQKAVTMAQAHVPGRSVYGGARLLGGCSAVPSGAIRAVLGSDPCTGSGVTTKRAPRCRSSGEAAGGVALTDGMVAVADTARRGPTRARPVAGPSRTAGACDRGEGYGRVASAASAATPRPRSCTACKPSWRSALQCFRHCTGGRAYRLHARRRTSRAHLPRPPIAGP
jgi:hypothetical protein